MADATYTSSIAARASLLADIKAHEDRLSALRANLKTCEAGIAALDSAGDLARTMSTACAKLHLWSAVRRDYLSGKIVGRVDDGGDVRAMLLAAIELIASGKRPSFVAQTKNYECFHNQYEGVSDCAWSPRHGSVTWRLSVYAMTDEQREAALGVLRAIVTGRITAAVYADLCDESKRQRDAATETHAEVLRG